MPLDPIIKRIIKKAYLNGFGDIHQFNAEQMRRFFTHPKLRVQSASFQDFTTSDAIILRCYTPSHLDPSALPAVVYLSANAFVVDRLDGSNDYCSLLANSLEMKVINIAHRLAPEHKFPRFVFDCLDGVEWVYDHAADLKINRDHIAIWGESSGASIAASLTHLFRDQGKSIIKHQTLFYPMVDLVNTFASKEEYGFGFMLDKSFIEWLDARGFHAEQNRSDPLASPLLQPNFASLPPATVITAECDPLRDEGEAYVEKLRRAGNVVVSKRFEGVIHGFMRYYPTVKATKEALELAVRELRRWSLPSPAL